MRQQTLSESPCPDGGILREVYKDLAWGQVNVRTLPAGKSKPGHVHYRRREVWVLARGEDVWVTMDQGDGAGTWTFKLPLWYCLNMEPGIGHSVENRGSDEAVILFSMSEVYDPEDPDKEPWDPTVR